jgi:hypothetical protein
LNGGQNALDRHYPLTVHSVIRGLAHQADPPDTDLETGHEHPPHHRGALHRRSRDGTLWRRQLKPQVGGQKVTADCCRPPTPPG